MAYCVNGVDVTINPSVDVTLGPGIDVSIGARRAVADLAPAEPPAVADLAPAEPPAVADPAPLNFFSKVEKTLHEAESELAKLEEEVTNFMGDETPDPAPLTPEEQTGAAPLAE
jgi:hypothetical protein